MHHAKTHLSRLLRQAQAGEEIVIARAGRPLVRLTPVHLPRRRRRLGTAKGRIRMADDFNAPLPPDILESFES